MEQVHIFHSQLFYSITGSLRILDSQAAALFRCSGGWSDSPRSNAAGGSDEGFDKMIKISNVFLCGAN